MSYSYRFNRATGLLGMSYAQFKPDELGRGGGALLKLLSMLRLVAMETGVGENKDEIRVNNLTLINFVIKWVGPQREDRLTNMMMSLQVSTLTQQLLYARPTNPLPDITQCCKQRACRDLYRIAL